MRLDNRPSNPSPIAILDEIYNINVGYRYLGRSAM